MKPFEDMTANELAAVIVRWTAGMYRRDVLDKMDSHATGIFKHQAHLARSYALRPRPGLTKLRQHYQYLRGFYE